MKEAFLALILMTLSSAPALAWADEGMPSKASDKSIKQEFDAIRAISDKINRASAKIEKLLQETGEPRNLASPSHRPVGDFNQAVSGST